MIYYAVHQRMKRVQSLYTNIHMTRSFSATEMRPGDTDSASADIVRIYTFNLLTYLLRKCSYFPMSSSVILFSWCWCGHALISRSHLLIVDDSALCGALTWISYDVNCRLQFSDRANMYTVLLGYWLVISFFINPFTADPVKALHFAILV